MTEKECYRRLYGFLIDFVPHYNKLDCSPGAVNFIHGFLCGTNGVERDIMRRTFLDDEVTSG